MKYQIQQMFFLLEEETVSSPISIRWLMAISSVFRRRVQAAEELPVISVFVNRTKALEGFLPAVKNLKAAKPMVKNFTELSMQEQQNVVI